MKERPIIFSGPMVRAILEGRKTQTRRIVKTQGEGESPDIRYVDTTFGNPYGKAGDRLWVRETWQPNTMKTGPAHYYRATDEEVVSGPWKSPIFMPRAASRILLEITDVRVERVQEITEKDAKQEAAEYGYFDGEGKFVQPDEETERLLGECGSYRQGFLHLWQSIHGPASWEQNPWVWVVEFKKIEP